MKTGYNRAIAIITSMIVAITLMAPAAAYAATDEPVAGQAEKLDRGKIRVLEIYPNDISREKENVSNMDVVSRLGKDPRYEVTTMSINRLISLKDDINGNYDVVYFNGGKYTRNYVEEYSYGSDITKLCAGKLKEFIESGQLCIFHEKIFENSGDPIRETTLKEEFSGYINDSKYSNVVLVNDKNKGDVIGNLHNLYNDTARGLNPRPILEIVEAPAAYSADHTDPVSNRLTFRFRVYDPNTDENADLKVALYIDRNNDSLYNDKEIVYYQDDGDGVKYTLKVKNGRSGTITYDMPQTLTGVYFWKLAVRDDQNAKAEFESVFRLKGKPISVRLLQIQPNTVVSNNPYVTDNESNGHGNLSLKIKFGKPIDGHTYREKPGEYSIEVDEITVKEFNRLAENDQIDLNGVYDMVVLGFNDNYTEEEYMKDDYSGALGAKAVELLEDFIRTKQSVMFTHDTIHFTFNRELTRKFGTAVGQVFKMNENGEFIGVWTAGLAGSDIETWKTDVNRESREEAIKRINIFDPVNNPREGNNSRHYQTINTYPDNATMVKPVNSSAVTLYPFILEGGEYNDPKKMEVAPTHYQWYKLNLEDPDVVPLFNLYAGEDYGKFNDDAMNNYYTYTKGTITYSGTGHKRDNSKKYPVFETKLFVNTAIKAYVIANHAPQVAILAPQDNEKISGNDGDLELRFRAYDFDFGDDYLYYEVFIDTADRGEDDDFVSLTDGEKNMMRNGQQISFTVPEDKMPDVGKFRLKVYAEDEHKANAFEIITLERADSPMITPDIVICDINGDPIEGALVNQEVTAQMKFTVSGKTAAEKVCAPVFDLKGAYYTESEKEYLVGQGLGNVVFSSGDPKPKEIVRDHKFTINPSSHGETELTMAVTVRKVNGLFDAKSAADSVRVRSGQVEFYVKDGNGDPVENAPVVDADTGTVIGYTNSSGYLYAGGLVGTKNFTLGSVPGFSYIGDMAIYRMDGSGSWKTESRIDLTYDDYKWKVEFTVDSSHGLTIDYYRLNMNRTAVTAVGSAGGSTGGTIHEVKNHKLTNAAIVAMVTVDPLVSGEVRRIDFTIETKKKTGEGEKDVEDALLKAFIVDEPDSGVAGLVPGGCTQLRASNELSEGSYAGRTYFLLIEVPKTDDQIVRISEVTLTTYTASGVKTEKKIEFSGGVKFMPITPPMLR